MTERRWSNVRAVISNVEEGGATYRQFEVTVTTVAGNTVGQTVLVEPARLVRKPELYGEILNTMVRDISARVDPALV